MTPVFVLVAGVAVFVVTAVDEKQPRPKQNQRFEIKDITSG